MREWGSWSHSFSGVLPTSQLRRRGQPPSRQVLGLPAKDSLAFPRSSLRWLVAEWSSPSVVSARAASSPPHPHRELQAALENNQIYSL